MVVGLPVRVELGVPVVLGSQCLANRWKGGKFFMQRGSALGSHSESLAFDSIRIARDERATGASVWTSLIYSSVQKS